ncbi:glutathione S-transferase [Pseudomassariella vexata]|uniref:Glutathione S-transferase n=1 Tax=Pseudomassariella vexata TaxID=1141098 RepID=A0A1Y2DW64_9PEZI|nr:glutathione S-transferase [Pseudomassariella vexata]ORY63376.1 glutathione S-transferase [Pseudomassariella vexata]
MAPFGKIYSWPGNFRVQRAQVVAELNGLELDIPSFDMASSKTPEFLSKFPMGKVPALECADGFCLAEGAAICMYLAGQGPMAPQLLGAEAGPQTTARIAEWTLFAESELIANVIPPFIMAVLKIVPYDEAKYESCVVNFDRALKRLDLAIDGGKKRYLVGGQLTLADIMVAGPLLASFNFLFDAELRKAFPGVVTYLEGLMEKQEFKNAFGEITKCETRVKA